MTKHEARRLFASAAALTAVAMIVAPAQSANAEPPGVDCHGPWGARVQGAPPYAPGDRGGVYLWHDDGFHLRVTHRGDGERVYAGTITSPTPMRINPVDLDPHDQLGLSPDGRTITFAFNDFGRTDGVDFTTDCADWLTVGPLVVDGIPLSTDRIFLGGREIRPENNPLTVHRADR
jgi:hypothetical protein